MAAYCRVSTEEERQKDSFENQWMFFKKAIEEHPDWLFAGIFGDNAKTGTSVVKRYGFQSMMRQAEKGSIDYIITKSMRWWLQARQLHCDYEEQEENGWAEPSGRSRTKNMRL